MGDTLKMLKMMVEWCPSCHGRPESIFESVHYDQAKDEVVYTPRDSCPKCSEARAWIKKLEAKPVEV